MDHRPLNGALGDDQASVLLAAVEQQLTRYFASISRQVEAIKVTNAEALAHQQAVNGEYQEALRSALEERLTAFAQYQHDRLSAIEGQLTSGGGSPLSAAQPALDPEALSGLSQQFLSKVDATERQLVDRLLQLEARITEEQGTRIAHIESTVGRIGAGFDDSVGAMSQRVLALDTKLQDLALRVDELAQHVAKGGSADIDTLRAQAAAAANDAAIARTELERIAGTVTRQFDQHATRLAELESRAVAELDVDAAVQTERLDELERQMLRLSGSIGSSTSAGSAAPATIIAAPADLGLAAALGATIAATAPVVAAPAQPEVAAPAAYTPAPAAPAPEPVESALPTLPPREPVAATVAAEVAPAAPAPAPAPAPATPSFMLDPDVWGTDSLVPEVVQAAPAASAAPATSAAPFADDPFAAFAPAAAPVPETATVASPAAAEAAPLTRTMTAPPPMTLMPKLPSSRTVDSSDRIGDELARLLAQQP
jgi:hypothetical protein